MAAFFAYQVVFRLTARPAASYSVLARTEAVGATFYRILFVTISRSKRASAVFFAQVTKALLEHSTAKGLQMAVDHHKNLRRLREILRKQRRELVATMVGAKKEPTKFAPLVELQEACDAVEWALEDEAAAAKESETQ